jgi:hypothetical protein
MTLLDVIPDNELAAQSAAKVSADPISTGGGWCKRDMGISSGSNSSL